MLWKGVGRMGYASNARLDYHGDCIDCRSHMSRCRCCHTIGRLQALREALKHSLSKTRALEMTNEQLHLEVRPNPQLDTSKDLEESGQ